MKGSFLGTSASRIATAFFCKSKGGLDKGFYLPKPIQSRFSQVAGHSMTWHKVSIYTSLMLVNKKMIPSRKNILRRVGYAEKRQDWSGSETRKIFTLHCCFDPILSLRLTSFRILLKLFSIGHSTDEKDQCSENSRRVKGRL